MSKGSRTEYAKLYEVLAQSILTGSWPAEHQVPSERQLCEEHGVSRTTVRRAVEMAERRGLVVRVPGRGTFVAQPHVAAKLGRMIAFREAWEEKDVAPSVEVISVRRIDPQPMIGTELGLRAGDQALLVIWTARGRGTPIGLYESYVSPRVADVVQECLSAEPAKLAPTYELSALALGVDTLLVDQTFEAVTADKNAARYLSIEHGSPVFRVTSSIRTVAGVAVEYNVALFAGLRYSLQMARELKLGSTGRPMWNYADLARVEPRNNSPSMSEVLTRR